MHIQHRADTEFSNWMLWIFEHQNFNLYWRISAVKKNPLLMEFPNINLWLVQITVLGKMDRKVTLSKWFYFVSELDAIQMKSKSES